MWLIFFSFEILESSNNKTIFLKVVIFGIFPNVFFVLFFFKHWKADIKEDGLFFTGHLSKNGPFFCLSSQEALLKTLFFFPFAPEFMAFLAKYGFKGFLKHVLLGRLVSLVVNLLVKLIFSFIQHLSKCKYTIDSTKKLDIITISDATFSLLTLD